MITRDVLLKEIDDVRQQRKHQLSVIRQAQVNIANCDGAERQLQALLQIDEEAEAASGTEAAPQQ